MRTATYATRRSELETYFDRTAVEAWSRLTSDAPVSRIRATVRAGRDRMRNTLLSWLPNARDSFVGVWLGKLVEPYLTPFRRIIPPIGGMIDISPIVALIALRFVAYGLDAVVRFFIPS